MSKYLNRVVMNDLYRDTEIFHEYYDLTLINNDNNNSKKARFQFTEQRNSEIISNPSEYFMSIIRFNLDTSLGLPLMIPHIQLNQTDPNLLIYSFTMKYKTFEFQQFCEFTPQDKGAQVPNVTNNTYQDLSTGYYYLYNYSYFVNEILNDCLDKCFTGIKTTAHNGSNTEIDGFNNKPFFTYDPTTQQLILNCDKSCFDNSLDNPIYIYCNSAMGNLIPSFELDYYGDNIVNGKNYKINVYSFDGNLNVIDFDTWNAIQMYQEYSNTANWCCIRTIFFTSDTIPINPSLEGQPKIFNSNTGSLNSSSNLSKNIITDFSVNNTDGLQYYPSISYTATGQYRLIDLFGHNAIKNIEISAYWSDCFGNYHPIYLSSGSCANLKIMFVKKSFYKDN